MPFWGLFSPGRRIKYDPSNNTDMLLSASPALYGGYPDYSKEELYIAKAFGGFEGELNVKDASAYDFLWTIKSFTLLTENSKSKQSSGRFGAKGYTWKLICYPNGNLSKNHISLYVMLAKAPEQQSEAVFKVSFQLFLFDKTSGSTFSRKGESHAQAYDEIGFRNFMDLKVFRNPSKGYLVNNSCMFGVKILQVTPIKTTTECLHPVKEITHEYSCKIDSFSKLDKTTSTDKKFTAGDYIWSIHIHPDGDQTSDAKGKHLSLYLYYYGSVSDVSATKVSAEFTLTIIDQVKGKHKEKKYTDVFKSCHPGWGKRDFIPLKDFKDPSQGFLIKDSCIIQAKITVLALVK